tara:strand:- start:1357 stop:1539 length:183 start_codon:yes stop_codon:yes gene_type:complete
VCVALIIADEYCPRVKPLQVDSERKAGSSHSLGREKSIDVVPYCLLKAKVCTLGSPSFKP